MTIFSDDSNVWNILIVDDDEEDYLVVRELLSNVRPGHFVLEWARSYEEGRAAISCGKFDAMLVDNQLGNKTGIDFIQEAVAEDCQIPAILYTGYGSLDVDLRAMHAGAVEYLDKNRVNADLLEKTIRYAIKTQKAEEILRRNESHYRLLFETMLQGVVYQDADGTIISMNPAAERILGKRPEDFLGQNSVDQEWHTLKEDGTPFPGMDHPSMVALRSGKEVKDVVMGVYNPREKRYHWIKISAVPLFRPGQQHPYQVYTLFDDISEQRSVEQALRDSEERYRSLVELSPDAIFVQTEGRFQFINQAGLQLFGVEQAGEIIGQPVLNYFCAEDRALVSERMRVLNEERRGVPMIEEHVLRRDGSTVDVEVVAAPYIYNGMFGALVVARDISHRKKIENALRESEFHFRLALTNVPVTVFEMDRDLKYTWIYNPPPGFTIAGILGKTDVELLGEQESAELTALKREVIESGKGIHKETQLTIQGKTAAYDGVYEPIIDENNQVTGLTGAMMDVTALRQLKAEQLTHQARIEVQRRLIEQREQERLQIARDLHDGPLQELIGLSYMLQSAHQETDRREVDHLLGEIENHLQKQINELRSFASELRPPTLVGFGLEKAIRAHLIEFKKRYPEINVDFQAEQHGNLLEDTVRLALYRVYQELMNNIIKHAEATQVNIQFYKTEQQAWLEVADNGHGFVVPTDWVDLARNKHLGLVGIQERIEAVGGTVHITSSPGRGTSVSITVPLSPAASPV